MKEMEPNGCPLVEVNTHFEGPIRSAFSTSSATILRKSKMLSVLEPLPERWVTHPIIQSVHCDGFLDVNLSASAVSCSVYQFLRIN
jgi:hypothetical protein